MTSGINGIETMISAIRINRLSIQPPLKPAIIPTVKPIADEINTAITPTSSVILPPCIKRVNTSRP